MGRKAKVLQLSSEDRDYLEQQTRARTIQAQTVNRARILLLKADGLSVADIADKVGLNRKSVMLCIEKYVAGGVENALFDAPRRGRNPEISDEEKAWIINIACQKPTAFGYSAETWTYARLTSHINTTAEAAGYANATVVETYGASKAAASTMDNDAHTAQTEAATVYFKAVVTAEDGSTTKTVIVKAIGEQAVTLTVATAAATKVDVATAATAATVGDVETPDTSKGTDTLADLLAVLTPSDGTIKFYMDGAFNAAAEVTDMTTTIGAFETAHGYISVTSSYGTEYKWTVSTDN